MVSKEFGFYPIRYDVDLGDFKIETLERFEQSIDAVMSDVGVHADWIYAPLREERRFGIPGTRTLPFTSRIFGLPKTHRLIHTSDDPKRVAFLIRVFGLFVGMKQSDEDAGFLDAATLKPGTSNDVVWCGQSLDVALARANDFYTTHAAQPTTELAVRAAIHSYLLSDLPTLLDYERFLHLYTATEAAAKAIEPLHGKAPGGHGQKIAHVCQSVGVSTPWWADGSNRLIADERNRTIHEGLFLGEPWGYMSFGGLHSTERKYQNLLLEMQKLVSRLLMGLLGVNDEGYLTSRLDDRQRHGIHLSAPKQPDSAAVD